MAEKAAPEPELASSELANLSAFGIDLEIAAQLGAQAKGVTALGLPAPAEAKGLPKAVPVGFRHGEHPDIIDISKLFEPYRLFPARKAGTASAQTLESFIALTNRHKTADSVIFADMDWKNPSLTTVVDYHRNASGGDADNCRHRVHYAYPLSEEWQKWISKNGVPMKQAEFAFFLEDRVPELSAPDDDERVRLEAQFNTKIATPSQLIELSRGLQVHVSSKVKNTTTLQTGEGQIAWEESHQDADGKPLKVPGIFILSIAPFFMGDKVRIPVRLRYRPAGSEVVWFFEMYRPDEYITEHVRHTLADARRETGLPTYEGRPEIAA